MNSLGPHSQSSLPHSKDIPRTTPFPCFSASSHCPFPKGKGQHSQGKLSAISPIYPSAVYSGSAINRVSFPDQLIVGGPKRALGAPTGQVTYG